MMMHTVTVTPKPPQLFGPGGSENLGPTFNKIVNRELTTVDS